MMRQDKMKKKELEKIKQKALEEHIPIIMDDTLEVVDKILKEVKPKRILEQLLDIQQCVFLNILKMVE